MDKANNGGTQILMNSYSLISTLSQRAPHLKLNMIPSLFGSFDPKPIYLRTDPITERVIATVIPSLDHVRTFIDMVHDYNLQRDKDLI